MKTRDLILSYMRHKRTSCETVELAKATKRSQQAVYRVLKQLQEDGVLRVQQQAGAKNVRWHLKELEAA